MDVSIAGDQDRRSVSAHSDRPNVHKLLLSEDPDDALDKSLQDHMINSLWSSSGRHDTSIYFDYFEKECEAWRLSDSNVAIQTYQDFLDLVEHIKSCHHEPISSSAVLGFFPPLQPLHEKASSPYSADFTSGRLQVPLKERLPACDAVAARNSLFLAVRLWLMLNVNSSDIYAFTPGRSSLEWTEDQSLDDFIDVCFPASEYTPARLSQWPYSLNAYNLERVGGFIIVWTDHLADHLYLNEDLGHIHIYHHVQVLRGLLRAKNQHHSLPEKLIVETLQSLTLLIPRANVDCKRWFAKNAENIDGGAGDVEPLRWARLPEKYKYWGQRLEIIRLAYDASEPKDLGQWWRDRRNKVQWYTFWVAILILVLTIVFGLIQSITGVMQVYYAAHGTPSN